MDGVSFVCTLYNKERYLPGVIAALAAQAPARPRQFVFVDDGSSDRSVEIVRELTANWPNTEIVCQPNGGPASATNTGIARARLPYLKLVGSDDVLAPYATDLMIEILERTGAAAVFSRIGFYRDAAEIAFDEAGARACAPVVPEDALAEVIRFGVSGTTPTLFRTLVVQAVGGCDPDLFVEDVSLALRVARVARIARLEHVTCYGPAADPTRIMVERRHQTGHDFGRALVNLLRAHPELDASHGRLAFRRAAGRAWHFARRHGGAGWLSRYAALYGLSRLGLSLDHAGLIEATLGAFALGPDAKRLPLVRPRQSKPGSEPAQP